jgi:hypothetical protein
MLIEEDDEQRFIPQFRIGTQRILSGAADRLIPPDDKFAGGVSS